MQCIDLICRIFRSLRSFTAIIEIRCFQFNTTSQDFRIMQQRVIKTLQCEWMPPQTSIVGSGERWMSKVSTTRFRISNLNTPIFKEPSLGNCKRTTKFGSWRKIQPVFGILSTEFNVEKMAYIFQPNFESCRPQSTLGQCCTKTNPILQPSQHSGTCSSPIINQT